MTKRIVSGIFILTALGALGVILAGALTSGEQLIVRFLTAVIVAALGLYVISDLRLQADDDAMTSRASGSGRLSPVDAPPNSTAAFMATVTKKSDVLEDDLQTEQAEQLKPVAMAEPLVAERQEHVALTGTDAGVFGRIDDKVTMDVADQTLVGIAVSTGELAAVAGDPHPSISSSDESEPAAMLSGDRAHRRIVPSRPALNGHSSRADATVTDIFAATTTTFAASSILGEDTSANDDDEDGGRNPSDGFPGDHEAAGSSDDPDGISADSLFVREPDTATDAEPSIDNSVDDSDWFARDDGPARTVFGDGPVAAEHSANGTGETAVEARDGADETGDGADTDDSEQSDDADLTRLLQLGASTPSTDGDSLGDEGTDDETGSELPVNGSARNGHFANGATSAKISFSSSPVVGDNVSFGDGVPFTDSGNTDSMPSAEGDNGGGGPLTAGTDEVSVDFAIHDLADLDDQNLDTEGGDGAAAEFEYSDDLDSPDLAWPAPPAKVNGATVNGAGKAHPFEKISMSDGESTGLNGHSAALPVPTTGLQAADYADAPLAPIIDLRDVSPTSDNIDVAINAGEVEVIATLIEQGMLSTDGPISDRDVRTMVYVAFTSNELRKLLLAGGSPDGPNHGLDLGPVELFDERIHAPAPKRLYSGSDQKGARTQIG